MQPLQKLTLLLLLSCCTPIVSAQTYLNLDFETMSGNQIRRWTIRNNAAVYTIDSVEKVSGNYSYKISKINPNEKRDAFFVNILPPELVKGKNIILKGRIKTEIKKKAEAGLFLVAYDKTGKPIQHDEMTGKRIDHTSSWQEVCISAKIDSNAAIVSIGGACYGGELTAWFDNFELFIDGKKYLSPVPRTAALSKNELAVLKKYCYPLKSFDPNIETYTDLSILKQLTKDARIISLGESSHGSSEIFKMKHRIIKYLAQQEKFNILAFEANMPESAEVNKAILKKQFDQINLIEKLHLWPWHTAEVRNLLNWVQDYNQGQPKIEFAGFDMQNYNQAMETLKQALKSNVDIQKDLYEFEYFLSTIAYQYVYEKGKVSLTDEQIHRIAELNTSLKTMIQKSNSNATDKDWLIQNLRIIEQYLDQKIGVGNREEKRDRHMAENMLWLSAHRPDSKIIAWAHNGHVSKSHINLDKSFLDSPRGMGSYIADVIPCKSLAIGFTFYEGSYTAMDPNDIKPFPAETAFLGTYEHFLNQMDEPIFILDLKKIKADKPVELDWLLSTLPFRTIGGNKQTVEFRDTNIADAFDYLIFIKTSTNSHLLD
ncbi:MULTISPECIES: erythromycin esterase family protein [Sphingobacterium]|uniref:Erythromycin esterase family protein n=1 Tax=Sphingobacterium kitahiroshimense TaxID=470446 RepID=A0ABV0C0M5_9SPHI|nr:erythromycin esterase family protein [Sphingobacterium sp. JUb56]MBB2951314.1 erythromycin esterase [Sphingobacterium sp. JUb56]